jgi:hypothetical protein
MARAKSRGFSDVLYLDSANKKNLEEVSSCNIFLVKVPFKFILIGGFLFLFFFQSGCVYPELYILSIYAGQYNF